MYAVPSENGARLGSAAGPTAVPITPADAMWSSCRPCFGPFAIARFPSPADSRSGTPRAGQRIERHHFRSGECAPMSPDGQ